jgi:hypothetical protein
LNSAKKKVMKINYIQKRNFMRKITFLCAILLASFTVNAQTNRYVKPTATGTGDGSSWANAIGATGINTMISQVSASADKGTVYFAAGTYLLTETITMQDRVHLMGGYNDSGERDLLNSRSILDAQNTPGVRIITAAYVGTAFTKPTVVDGFVMQHGAGDYGSAVQMSLGLVVRNCIIRNNNGGTYGAAIYVNRNTEAPKDKIGGGIYNCVIVNNTSGFGMDEGVPLPSSGGIFVDHDTHVDIFNTVVANNKCLSEQGTGGLYTGQFLHWSRFINNIFYNNEGEELINELGLNNFLRGAGTYRRFRHNYVHNLDYEFHPHADNFGNKRINDFPSPEFVNPTAFVGYKADGIAEIDAADWRLKSTSPLINLGRTEPPSYPWADLGVEGLTYNDVLITDIAGGPRVIGDMVDIGAYEFNPETSVAQRSIDEISIYPNPTTDMVYFNNVPENSRIFLIDMTGRSILEKKASEMSGGLSLQPYSNGVYLIRVIHGQESVKTVKVLKK